MPFQFALGDSAKYIVTNVLSLISKPFFLADILETSINFY